MEKRNRWFERMQNVFDSAPSPWNDRHVLAVNGVRAQGRHDLYLEPERWVEDCLEELAERFSVVENEVWFQPLCVEYNAYGVHYIDKMLGCRVFREGNQWYNACLPAPVGQLQAPDPDQDEVWKTTRRAMEAFLEADVKLPLFGLPTIASALNIAVNLYGQDILMEMLLDPEKASADLTTINQLLCDLHQRSRALLPEKQLQPVISWNRTQPPGYGQLCGCTTQLISAQCYEELVAPLDDRLLSVYPHGGMIHLCGRHVQHIPAFRSMKHLKALQLNDRAAEDLLLYHQELRSDQIIYLNPCDGMTIEKAVEITKGERLILAANLPSPVLKP